MTRIDKALIIGGGIAGPVEALALRRAGIGSTVCEARPKRRRWRRRDAGHRAERPDGPDYPRSRSCVVRTGAADQEHGAQRRSRPHAARRPF